MFVVSCHDDGWSDGLWCSVIYKPSCEGNQRRGEKTSSVAVFGEKSVGPCGGIQNIYGLWENEGESQWQGSLSKAWTVSGRQFGMVDAGWCYNERFYYSVYFTQSRPVGKRRREEWLVAAFFLGEIDLNSSWTWRGRFSLWFLWLVFVAHAYSHHWGAWDICAETERMT